jgi:uncharacterized protein (TIGR02246 family)
VSDPTTRGIQATFASLSSAWKKGDGAAFSEWCTEDVDFINLLGMHVNEKIFRAPYKDSTVEFTIQSIRFISPGASLVIAPSRLDVPSGPVKGIVLSIASILFVRDDDCWKVASFHNTRREATQADHLAIMRDAARG